MASFVAPKNVRRDKIPVKPFLVSPRGAGSGDIVVAEAQSVPRSPSHD